MRTIKFKGKRVKDGQWIYGNLADYSFSVLQNTINKKVIFSNIVSFATDNFGFVVNDCEVDPDTVGQFTGLLDKNGKEIYEGDILSVRRYDNEFMSESEEFRDAFNIDELKGNEIETITDCVFYEEASFYVGNLYLASLFGNQKHSNPIHEFEVIGNIHDNPEPLNEK